MAKPEKRHPINEPLLRTFAKIIRENRRRQNITQEELAKRSGIHWRYIQEIEAGTKEGVALKNVSLSLFFDLAQGLKIDPVDLIRDVRTISKLDRDIEPSPPRLGG